MTRLLRADTVERLAGAYDAVLKSKRLMLQSTQRRLAQRPSEDLRQRAARLEAEIVRAAELRARLRVNHGEIEDPQFWIDAYAFLIQQGENLAGQLRRGRSDRIVDLPLIDLHLELWRRRLRDWMLVASA